MITSNVVLSTNTNEWVQIPIVGSILLVENNSKQDVFYRLGNADGDSGHVLTSGEQLKVSEDVWVKAIKKTVLAHKLVLVVTT